MQEKRKHKRVYFSLDEDFFVEIEGKASFKARLLSLSEGGLSFFLPIKKSSNFKKGDVIFLSSLKSENEDLINSLVSLSVRHVLEENNVGKVIVGCQFLDLPEKDRVKIKKLIEEKSQQLPI